MMFDDEDSEEIDSLFNELEAKIYSTIEKISYQYFTRMEKRITHILGYRERFPQDEYERYRRFVEFLENTYLIPSLSEE